ncbi:condensin-2 complex subunit D3-L-like [Mytilus trossulus]|uniref:condensin-2 complex subunit D3-L-like n=1 Tax=Mytilus trossulus TaxID=6551 RepID=UPI003005B176
MADLERTLEVFAKLTLQNFTNDWVKSIWDNDFTEIDPLDLAVEGELEDNGYHTVTFRILQTVFEDWKSNKEGKDGEGFWSVLVENDISHKSLIALFAYLMEIGNKKTSGSTKKEAGILSASCYIKMLSIPGSIAFKVFHPVLYEKAVDIIKTINTLGAGSKRKRSVSPAPSQKGKRGRGNKTRNQDPTLNLQDFGSDDDESIEELAPQEISGFRKLLEALLKDLISLLETTSLRQSESSAYHTVQILATLTRQDTDTYDGKFDQGTIQRLSLPGLAYRGLSLLCKPLHGHVGSLVNATCKYLLPNLLMLIGDNKVAAASVPKHIQVTKDHAMYFISSLLKTEERSVNTVKTLLQHMCTKVPDKAEYRGKVAQSVVTILQELPNTAYGHMVEWFYKLSKHSKINNRAFAMEVVLSLLSTPERQPDEHRTPETAVFIKHTSLLGILLARCSDAAPTVRTRAISSFSTCFLSKDRVIKETLQDIVTPRSRLREHAPPHLIPTPAMDVRTQSATDDNNTTNNAEKTAENIQGPAVEDQTPMNANQPPGPGKTPFHGVYLTPFNPNMPDDDGVTSMFRRRAKDPKVNVRKAALHALENIIRFQCPDYSRQDLDVLVERCRDPALSVRKQSMQSLTDLLLDFPTEKPLQKSWLEGVMPLVIDRETTLQEKCMDQLEEIILHNIVPLKRMTNESHRLAWDVLNIMTRSESVDLRKYLQKACRHWSRQGKIKATLISNLQTHVNTDNNEVAWMLLAELAPAVPKMCHGFVIEYWEQQAHTSDETDYSTLQRVLSVMACSAKFFPEDKRDRLIDYLRNRLLQFNSPPELISITIETLSKLCESKAEATNKRSEKDAWCVDLLKACDTYLSHVILEEYVDPINEDMVVRHLFTLGEIAQICPAKTPKRIFLIVQSMIAAPCISAPASHGSVNISSGSTESSENSEKTTRASSRASTRTSTGSVGSTEDHTDLTQKTQLRFSQQTQGFSQIQLTQAFSQFQGSKMSNRIRAFAFIALGKLCLQNPDLAKKCVAALARELETCKDPTIRNNVVIIMCDLCVRYTTTADRYVSNIAACLKDESPLVRKQTLTLFTRLLQEDFLKWKGVLFFRFIMTLLDSNKEIADFAEFCLVHLLMQRHPTMFFQHFLECIFHFNAYEDHATFNKFPQNEKEKRMFCLNGDHNASKRLKLYLFMLEYMTDEHRFQMTAKMAQEILGGVVDGIIPLNDKSSVLLKDTLAILSSKEIKLSSLRAKPQDEMAGDDEERAAVVMAVAKKTLITQVVKKNVIENIVPIVVSLKHMLEQQRSPVLKDLMMYLRELLKDYKNEVQEILSADKQLATEIEFDLRKFEEQEEETERQRNATIVQATSHPGSPQVSSKPTTPSGSKPGTPSSSKLCSPRLPIHGGSPRLENHKGSPRPGSSTRKVQKGGSKQVSDHDGSVMGPPAVQVTGATPMKTPAREASLSTLAILNSARKAFERAQNIHDSLSKSSTEEPASAEALTFESPALKKSSKRKSILKEKKKSHDDEEEDESPHLGVRFAEGVKDKATPPRALRGNRAISTPSAFYHDDGVLNNITFHADQNVTLIPPSPIPTCMPIRVFGDASDENATPGTPQKVAQGSKDTVYMFSPDKPLPRPRKWNIKSPAPSRGVVKKESSENEDPSDENEAAENTEKTNKQQTKPRSKTRRSARLSKS